MNESISDIIQQIKNLEDELEAIIEEQKNKALYTIKGKRVEFEETIKKAHKKLKVNLFFWLSKSRPRHLISAPIIYSLLIPMALFDIALTFYQFSCFRLYNIPRVKRSKYIIIDRQHLHYLNGIEKINCMYCAYANGLIAYAREIAARTEQYWCPIKHARRVTGTHRRYSNFLAYGDADDFHNKADKVRLLLREEKP